MTKPQDLRLVIFDVDGTLIDSQENIIEAMHRTFAGLGLPPLPKDEVLSIVGLSLEQAIERLMPSLGRDDIARGAALYRQSFVALRAEKGGEATSPLYPGAKEV
ncbi:MAG: HAD hydrolase-like protein, partial [Paracoccaceae bacterium]|nr:HAD hydrolase-like protein [Paracoccaceae bacterium]